MPEFQSEGKQEQFHDVEGLGEVGYPRGVGIVQYLSRLGGNLTRRGFLSGPHTIVLENCGMQGMHNTERVGSDSGGESCSILFLKVAKYSSKRLRIVFPISHCKNTEPNSRQTHTSCDHCTF